MKKILYMLLFIQCGLMMAQNKTVVTIYGEKVIVNPNAFVTANNGTTASNQNVQLGGSLIKATTIITTDTNTLAIKGLQAGSIADSVIVADSNGILKKAFKSAIGDNLGNHIATVDLLMSNKNIKDAVDISDSGKVTTNTFQIAKGSDGKSPAHGSIAIAADADGNIMWKAPDIEGITTAKLVGMATVTVQRATSGTNVFFDTNIADAENAFSGDYNGGSVYTVKKAGLHQVYVNLQAVTIGTTWYLRIKKNGVVIAAIDANSYGDAGACVFAMDNFIVGDKINVDMGGTVKGYRAADKTIMSVFRFE